MTGDERDDETAQVIKNVINIESGQMNGIVVQMGHFTGDLVMPAPKSDEPD